MEQPLKANSSILIQENIPLHDKNWFATGGPARFFCQPHNNLEFQEALYFAHAKNHAVFILGQGANILISDNGFDGLIINPALTSIAFEQKGSDIILTAGAGVILHDLILYCLHHNILGLEEFSGIPSSIGGAVYINLHYFEFLLEQFLMQATVINRLSGKIEIVNRDWFGFGYNISTLQKDEYYLLDATFLLKKGTDLEIAHAQGRRKEIIRHRQKRYPNAGTCGSFFRNFYDQEVILTINNRKAIWVAYYLDKVGIKGTLQRGNALVSGQHANMIINTGNAKSWDIIELARTMQQMVQQEFGILPQPECRLVGFKEYPLLTLAESSC